MKKPKYNLDIGKVTFNINIMTLFIANMPLNIDYATLRSNQNVANIMLGPYVLKMYS